jgi:hypothetical protein
MPLHNDTPRSLRAIGNRLTGGGIRALASKAFSESADRAMNNPVILTLGRTLLKPFPDLTNRLYRLASKGSNSNRFPDLEALPASARIVYVRLRDAFAAYDAWNRTR